MRAAWIEVCRDMKTEFDAYFIKEVDSGRVPDSNGIDYDTLEGKSGSLKQHFYKEILPYHAKFKLYTTDKNEVNFLKEWNEVVRAKKKDHKK